MSDKSGLITMATSSGSSVDAISRAKPVLLVFLRHAGCTFCREALDDLKKIKPDLDQQGIELVIAQMGTESQGLDLVRDYGLAEVPVVSDPERKLYREMGLQRGTLGQLLGWGVWWRGFVAAMIQRHGVGRLVGDGFQMPGVFLIVDGKIVASYLHKTAADRPDYLQIACSVK